MQYLSCIAGCDFASIYVTVQYVLRCMQNVVGVLLRVAFLNL